MAKQYTGKERVEAVFQREQADRIPVVLELSVQLASQAGYGLNEASPAASLLTRKIAASVTKPIPARLDGSASINSPVNARATVKPSSK